MRSIFKYLGAILSLCIWPFLFHIYESIPADYKTGAFWIVFVIGFFVGIIPIFLTLMIGWRFADLAYLHAFGAVLIDAQIEKNSQKIWFLIRYRKNYIFFEGVLLENNNEWQSYKIASSEEFKNILWISLGSLELTNKKIVLKNLIHYLKQNSKDQSCLTYRFSNDRKNEREILTDYKFPLSDGLQIQLQKVTFKSSFEIDLQVNPFESYK